MRQKTYLNGLQQWHNTLELYSRRGVNRKSARGALGDRVFLGTIVRPHRLFLEGDVVIIEPTHAAGHRHAVFAVSGKGYPIVGLYLEYEASRTRRDLRPNRFRGVKSKRKLAARIPSSTSISTYFPNGPLRFVEFPENLVGQFPDSPGVRQFVVENLARE